MFFPKPNQVHPTKIQTQDLWGYFCFSSPSQEVFFFLPLRLSDARYENIFKENVPVFAHVFLSSSSR